MNELISSTTHAAIRRAKAAQPSELRNWLGLRGVPGGVADFSKFVLEILQPNAALDCRQHILDVDVDNLVH